MLNCMNNKGNVFGNDHCEGCVTSVELSSLIVDVFAYYFILYLVHLFRTAHIYCVLVIDLSMRNLFFAIYLI